MNITFRGIAIRYKAVFVPLFLIITSLIGNAQQVKNVSLKFISFPKSADKSPLELLVGEEKAIAISAPSNEISKSYPAKDRGKWIIGKMATDDDGKSKFEVYGEVKSLSSDKQLLILIRKGNNNRDGFDIVALNGHDEHFGREKFLFFNATTVNIAGNIGSQKIALKPKAHKILRPKPKQGERKNLFHVSFAYPKGQEWKPFWSTMWPVHKNARSLVFFYQEPINKKLRIHAIRDFVQ